MSSFTNYAENKIVDALLRGQAIVFPATVYAALLVSTHGPRANSTAYALNNTISVLANDGKIHLYKCTTAGDTAAAQAALYPGVANEAITDGTAVFTEQSSALDAQTAGAWTEVTGAGYARVKAAAGATQALTDWKSTQNDNLVSTGTSGLSTNTNAITFGSPTEAWGFIWGLALYDAAAAGNPWLWGPLVTPKTVNAEDAAPAFAAGAVSVTLG